MEILYEELLNTIHEQCLSDSSQEVFKDPIIVNLLATGEDFKGDYHQVKREIMTCVETHFPDKELDILFEVRNGSWNCSFKIGKTAMSIVNKS
jgi:hypothetical protein